MKILLLFTAMLLFSCGAPVQEQAPSAPPAPQLPDDGLGGGLSEELTFVADVQPLLRTFCAQCHSDATYIATESAFLSSKAPTRIANKSMPQRGSRNYAQWGDAQRKIIADFVAASQ